MSNRHRRTAIVTGAARGIGAAVARRLADDGFGVAVLSLDEADCKRVVDDIESTGVEALAVGADVTDEAAVTTAVTRIADELGPPTVLVNNAGVTRDNLLFKMDVADWETVMNVHMRGSFLMSRAAQQYMTASGSPSSAPGRASRPASPKASAFSPVQSTLSGTEVT